MRKCWKYKYESEFEIGYNYINVPYIILATIEDFIRKIYINKRFKKIVEDDRKFKLKMERNSEFKAQLNFHLFF
jgi:hypothetical protein